GLVRRLADPPPALRPGLKRARFGSPDSGNCRIAPVTYRSVTTRATRPEARDTIVNVIVLAKYVPNPTGTPELGDDFLLKREGVEGAMDPTDEYGVEAGLRLVEKAGE